MSLTALWDQLLPSVSYSPGDFTAYRYRGQPTAAPTFASAHPREQQQVGSGSQSQNGHIPQGNPSSSISKSSPFLCPQRDSIYENPGVTLGSSSLGSSMQPTCKDQGFHRLHFPQVDRLLPPPLLRLPEYRRPPVLRLPQKLPDGPSTPRSPHTPQS